MRQAIKDSVGLWKHLERTGEHQKGEAIKTLYADGILSNRGYMFGCPLCENVGLSTIGSKPRCNNCPWPEYPEDVNCDGFFRCEAEASPYLEWVELNHMVRDGKVVDKTDFMSAAKKVRILLEEVYAKYKAENPA